MIRISEQLPNTPDIVWKYSRQLGVKYAGTPFPELNHKEGWACLLRQMSTFRHRFESQGYTLEVFESGPPDELIKLGLPGRDQQIEEYITDIRLAGAIGVPVICNNFMPVLGWTRTNLTIPARGGSMVTGYDHEDMSHGDLTEYGEVTQEMLWDNLAYFLDAVRPELEKNNVKLAFHPDDPPVDSILGISRILTGQKNILRLLELGNSPNIGITLCMGTYGAMDEPLPENIEVLTKTGKVFFAHFRDIVGNKYKFREAWHDEGQNDMVQCFSLFEENGFNGCMRVDHVATMEGEDPALAGYSAMGRLYATGYLRGILDALGCAHE